MTPRRVLLVDDESGLLRMYAMALARYGYATVQASDGREGARCVREGAFDVVVTDINMPVYGGLEFVKAVRERDPDLPVIVMTGKPSLQTSTRAVELQAFRYLTKPVMPGALRDVVEEAIRQHDLARQMREAWTRQVEAAKP